MKNQAFTLIELLVVVLIIGILVAIAVPQYQVAVIKTKINSAKQTANDIRKAIDLYYLQHDAYPKKFSDLDYSIKFDNNWHIQSDKYDCYMDTDKWYEIYCSIENWKIIYEVYLPTSRAECRVYSSDTSDVYHRACQQDTGKTLNQAEKNGDCFKYYY